MGVLLLLLALFGGYTLWRIRRSMTEQEALRAECAQRLRAAVETCPSGKPLPPLLETYERELWPR